MKPCVYVWIYFKVNQCFFIFLSVGSFGLRFKKQIHSAKGLADTFDFRIQLLGQASTTGR